MTDAQKKIDEARSYSEYVAEELKKQSHNYVSPTPRKFPIIADTPIPYEFFTRRQQNNCVETYQQVFERRRNQISEIYQSLCDCGFNGVRYGGGKDGNNVLKFFLSTIEEYPLAVILTPTWLAAENTGNISEDDYQKSLFEFEQGIKDYYNEYSGYPSIKAWEIIDEPKYIRWKTDDTYMMVMYRTMYDLEKNNPDNEARMVFFNLAASESDIRIGPGTGCYKGYLSILEALFKLPVWSYDLYPFKAKGDWNQKWMNTLLPDAHITGSDEPSENNIYFEFNHFFKYLEIFKDRSQRTGRPFWAYAMSIGHKIYHKLENDGITEYKVERYSPAPTVGMLRFEVFCALAYGAQGIVYWTYGQLTPNSSVKMDDNISDDTIYGEAPLSWVTNPHTDNDKNDKITYDTLEITDVWYCCQRVNQEIALFSDVFLGCNVMSVGLGNTKFNEWNGNPAISSFPAGCIIQLETSDLILISQLKNGNKNYMVIVNLNPFEETKNKIRFSLDEKYFYNFMTQWSGSKVTRPLEIYRKLNYPDFEIILPPGGFYIIGWK